MRGVFFVPPSILPQPATTAQKDCASARVNPTTFRENSSSFPKNLWTFCCNPSTPHPTRSPFAPFPTTTTRQFPPFGRKIREKSPNRASISTIHDFAPSKTVFYLTSHPHFKRLFRALFSAKRLPFVPNRHFSVILWQKSDRQRGASYKHSLSLLFEMCRLVVLLSSHLQKTAVDSPRNNRLQTHYLYARTRAEGVCLPFPLRKICFTLCQ